MVTGTADTVLLQLIADVAASLLRVGCSLLQF